MFVGVEVVRVASEFVQNVNLEWSTYDQGLLW